MLRDAEMTACLLFLWYDISLRFILTRPLLSAFPPVWLILWNELFGMNSLELTLWGELFGRLLLWDYFFGIASLAVISWGSGIPTNISQRAQSNVSGKRSPSVVRR